MNSRTVCTCAVFPQSASCCAFSGGLILLFCIHIDCTGIVFPRCASWYAVWGGKTGCMNSRTVCTGKVSPQCEWGCASSTYCSHQITCCSVGNCTSWFHCGPACGGGAHFCLQMSLDTRHKIFAWSSSVVTSTPIWYAFLTVVNFIEKLWQNTFPFTKFELWRWR